jgi:hypothetical protein
MHGWMKAMMQGGSACGGLQWEEGRGGREGRWEKEGGEVEPERNVGSKIFSRPTRSAKCIEQGSDFATEQTQWT